MAGLYTNLKIRKSIKTVTEKGIQNNVQYQLFQLYLKWFEMHSEEKLSTFLSSHSLHLYIFLFLFIQRYGIYL